MRKEDDRVTVTTKEARSGETSGHVRTVLIVGTIVAVVGLIVAAAIWGPG
jgi:CHASE3 domain sensor protein